MPAATIYKLLTRAELDAAQAGGVYCGSAHDARDGFIHFSTAAQLAGTARKYFAGVPDLVLLAVDVGYLTKLITPHPVPLPMGEGTPEQGEKRAAPSPLHPHPLADADTLGDKLAKASLLGEGQGVGGFLRWEPARDGDLFPHLYADLPISAVKSATAIPLATDGVPILPARLEP